MAKIFNLQFDFLNQQHKALVSVNSNQKEPYIHIQLFDSLFKKNRSLEHIRYQGFDGYKELPAYRDPFIQKLMEKIAYEVEKELSYNYGMVKYLFSCLR
jgi:hypothetical protein